MEMVEKAGSRDRFKVDDPIDGDIGRALWQKADEVLPGGGIYLSRSADMAGRGIVPGFVSAAEGCRITDADGRSYIDYLGANGPNILGYQHREIEAAVRRQMETLTSASFFPAAQIFRPVQLEALFSKSKRDVFKSQGPGKGKCTKDQCRSAAAPLVG